MKIRISSRIDQSLEMSTRLTIMQMQQVAFYGRELEEKIYGPQLSIKEEYRPGCPKCGRIVMMKPDGIMWWCITCDYNFTDGQMIVVPQYIVSRVADEGKWEVHKYPLPELKDKISALSPFITPSALFAADKTVYINLIHQLGSLENAFASIGIVYANAAKENWQLTIIDYAGILPDTTIAAIVGVSRQVIGYYRKVYDIPTAAENFEDLPVTEDKVEEIRALNNTKLRESIQVLKNKKFRNIRQEAMDLIRKNQGWTDHEIMQFLKNKGIKVSRRTINLYRHKAGLLRPKRA